MDDYNVNVLSEAKNEYSSRLVTILTPLILEGIKSIFTEALNLCSENDESDKYLMTFQNFLSRVPKWNTSIIEEECKRIVNKSGCNYLDDLITCVHITQLKILTSIRVSQKQKKIDIDIPKLDNFIHKCYIYFARKLYSNVYLYEKDIMPLNYQKNMREAELICQESILNVVRDNMPVETILRAYIDKTVDEEVIEEVETVEKVVDQPVTNENTANEGEKSSTETQSVTENNSIIKKDDEVEMSQIEKPPLEDKKLTENISTLDKLSNDNKPKEANINLVIDTSAMKEPDSVPVPINTSTIKEDVKKEIESFQPNVTNKDDESNKISSGKLSFNNTDSVLDLGTNKSSSVNAPKTVERLEEISRVQNEKRKEEEALEDDDDDDDKIKIHSGDDIKLNLSDIHNLNKDVDLKPDPILNDIEVLS